MALKSVVTDINTVDEAQRGLYEKKGDTYVLAIEDPDSHPSVSGLKSAFGKTKDELKALQKRLGLTFVFVTHDQHEALSMADSLAVFNEGRIAQIGSPQDIYDRPATRFVADFVGASTVLPPELTQSPGGPAQWSRLRPEATRLAPTGPVQGTVTALRYLGSGTRVVIRTGETEIAAMVPAGQPVPAEGETTAIAFEPAAPHPMGAP